MSSLDAKISYVSRDLNRNLKEERAFPLLLHCNYNEVIKPRSDILKDRVGYFDLGEAFFATDEEFCERWAISPEELEGAKALRFREDNSEREILWRYVNAF